MITLPIPLQFFIIFISQLLFIYFRTLNVMAVAEKNRLRTFTTGFGVNICWLVSVSLGVNAILHGHWILVGANVLGGLIGSDWAVTGRFNKKKVIPS